MFINTHMLLVTFAIATLTSVSSIHAADICSLLREDQAAWLLETEVQPGKTTQGMLPAGKICTYRSREGDASLKYKISSNRDITEEGLFDSAADIINRQRKARHNASIPDTTLTDKNRPGDDALWDGTSLWVLSDHTLLLITVIHHTEQTFADMDEMKKTLRLERRKRSIEAAQIILERLNQQKK
ncbi:hypothetical protein [Desulfogranum japonicum]|uniref:hypothetical protein n=1 Tax=Desulfogranum japonicum TaxID=231447 RepID=UPI000411DDEC|nr:hypothetical protein [Desulfogranum japonicum]